VKIPYIVQLDENINKNSRKLLKILDKIEEFIKQKRTAVTIKQISDFLNCSELQVFELVFYDYQNIVPAPRFSLKLEVELRKS